MLTASHKFYKILSSKEKLGPQQPYTSKNFPTVEGGVPTSAPSSTPLVRHQQIFEYIYLIFWHSCTFDIWE